MHIIRRVCMEKLHPYKPPYVLLNGNKPFTCQTINKGTSCSFFTPSCWNLNRTLERTFKPKIPTSNENKQHISKFILMNKSLPPLCHQLCKSVQIHFIKIVTVHLYSGVLKPPSELGNTKPSIRSHTDNQSSMDKWYCVNILVAAQKQVH